MTLLKPSFHNVTRNSVTTSDLSILMHDVISLPDATSYDKNWSFGRWSTYLGNVDCVLRSNYE